ncbi:MAG: lysylphosphatidylglycerol synthase domain-containing protein [Gammaproteobacteria bacterium]|nr:lysylphosphatidylglycerol synthase domain-containing protein [Gammaproteobacteria bacterium]
MEANPGGRTRLSPALLNTAGRLLALLGIAFVALEVYDNLESLQAATAHSSVFAIGLGAVIYTLALGTLSVAWMVMLNYYQGSRFSLASCHYCYARSQIAKYLPGNVFHYAGRYALSRSMGASDRAILSATAEELLGVAAVFAVCGTLAAALSGDQLEVWSAIPLPGLGLIMAIGMLGGRGLLALPLAGPYRLSGWSPRLLQSWGLFLLFLLLSLAVVLILTDQFRDLAGFSQLATLVAAFCLSWLLGFIVPGAPGGIGVREAAFILLLDPLGMGTQALSIVLQFRLITIVGDLLFFGSTCFVRQAAV